MSTPPFTRPPCQPRRRLGAPLLVLVAAGTAGAVAAGHAASGISSAGRPAALHVGSSTTTRASSGSPTGTAGRPNTTDDSKTARTAKAQAFTACMRSHGVPGFPGITIAADGRVNLNPTGGDVNPLSERYRSAAQTCASLLPNGSALPARPRPPSPTPPASLHCSGDCPPRPAPPKPVAEPS